MSKDHRKQPSELRPCIDSSTREDEIYKDEYHETKQIKSYRTLSVRKFMDSFLLLLFC